MLTILTRVVGPVRTNCYIAFDDAARRGVVIDPGDDAEDILSVIRQNHLEITHILLTHSHFDHILALPEVHRATGAPIGVHERDAAALSCVKGSLYARFYGDSGFRPMTPGFTFGEGTRIETGAGVFTVLHTSGHTPGSSCFDTGEALFCGDTLFAESCGRIDFDGGDADAMRASLRRLYELPGERMCYPGHDRAFRLSEARLYNPMLRGAVR